MNLCFLSYGSGIDVLYSSLVLVPALADMYPVLKKTLQVKFSEIRGAGKQDMSMSLLHK